MIKIVFAGSGSLVEALIETIRPHFALAGVVLSPQMPASALTGMKAFCQARNIHYQYGFEGLAADIYLTPNYPILLDSTFLKGRLCLNVHFALLPKYRGFHPVQCAIINDEKQVGYTLHQVDEGIDSGPIYFQKSFEVNDADNIHTLNSRLAEDLITNFLGYLNEIIAGKKPKDQNESQATWGGRRHPEDGLINWRETSREIFNLVRAVQPPYYPGAYTYLKDKKIIIARTIPVQVAPYKHIPGQIVDVQRDKGLLVKTGDTLLWLTKVWEDGVEHPAGEFIGLKIGSRFKSI
ncbi:MAG: methionyl-tRNA formyltransferase [Deltaproteobacteria bacterium]|nr:methionyl-tRNA formyltransferase [Deltaproteobacteria bacterium]